MLSRRIGSIQKRHFRNSEIRWLWIKDRIFNYIHILGAVHNWRPPLRREGDDLPKGDVTPYDYLVKWVTRGRRKGSKISKNGWRNLWMTPYARVSVLNMYKNITYLLIWAFSKALSAIYSLDVIWKLIKC